jgi:maltooligosyltrehalose trehalohydrolase
MERSWQPRLGAVPGSGGTTFRVWAPTAARVELVLYGGHVERAVAMEPEGEEGYFSLVAPDVGPGALYRYRLDGDTAYPDPASRSQPEGVHGPSRVVDPAFAWTDHGWRGVAADDLVIYELHVGTFTEPGTFAAASERLDHLVELGITAVEVMPIANFPGERNWGYDGVNLFAPSTAYGGPEAFRRFVDAAHARGLAVLLDVVYNHLGPEGNYIPAVTGGRFFTDRHHTPWGDAVNYDGPGSRAVRDFVIENALHWAYEYHVDGVRLDATHAIIDDSPRHFLQELADALHALQPGRLVIAEDERNERRLVLPREQGGFGLDGVWADDLHHQLRRLTAGDAEGYFSAYGGTVREVVETLRKGWWYEGATYPPHDAPRGTSAEGLPPRVLVHCIQNHDQVGNRALGSRLNHDVEAGVYRAASALLLASPYTPLLWMGQEWAASSPFQYFTDHPEELGRLVTQGRREEFRGFSAFSDPEQRERIPDPQDPETFRRSRLRWAEREEEGHAGVLSLYREMLALRREKAAFRDREREGFSVVELGEGALALRRAAGGGGGADYLLVASFRGEIRVELNEREETRSISGSHWHPVLATEERRFAGSGGWGRLEPEGTLHLTTPGAVLLCTEPPASS